VVVVVVVMVVECTYRYTCARALTHTQTRAHTHTNTCTHAHVHTHTTHTCTHTHHVQEWELQPEEIEEQRSLAAGGYVGVRRVARLLEVGVDGIERFLSQAWTERAGCTA